MGMNYARAGFENVEDMVAAMSDSEDRQLSAMAAFLRRTGLAASLQAHDWASFARGYNGPNYAINRYDIRLNSRIPEVFHRRPSRPERPCCPTLFDLSGL